MTEASLYLQKLAKRIIQPYQTLRTARAGMLTGSAAKGLSDFYSDIDMTIYYAEALPPEEKLEAIRIEHSGSSDRKWIIGNRDEGHFAEAFMMKGIEVQIGHTTIASWEQTIEHTLAAKDLDSPLQKAMEGTLACQILFGEPYLKKWQEQLSHYPDALAEAMVKQNLRFFPVWGLAHHFSTRDAGLWYQEILLETAQRIVAIFAGLNKSYFTTFQFKRTKRFIDSLDIKPEQLYERLESLFSSELSEALKEIQALVKETFSLVEKHMSAIDTSQAKARLNWVQQPWQIEAL